MQPAQNERKLMEIDKIIITIFGLLGIGFTYWYFLMKNEKATEVKESIDILVKGGYVPSVISVPLGKTTKINFRREDENSCLEEVVISGFRIKKFLPVNKTVSVEITPEKIGEYPFSCGMNMFHGKIIVKN